MEAGDTSNLFVGRQEKIEDFLTWLSDPKALPIQFYIAPGGMGKTWLLKAIKQALYQQEDDQLLILPQDPTPGNFVNIAVFDLIDAQQHSIDNLQETIATALGKEQFENYQVAQDRFESEESLTNNVREALYSSVRENFLIDLRNLCQQYQIVIFFDTFERVYWEEVGYWLTYILPQKVPNLRMVIAGRPSEDKQKNLGRYVNLVQLDEFNAIDDITKFFEKREAIDKICDSEVDADQSKALIKAITKKFKGVPLRLELSALLLTEGIIDVQQLMDTPQAEIEQSLIRHLHSLTNEAVFQVGKLSYSIYDIILKMSYLNRRFNSKFLAPVYAVDLGDAEKVLQAFFDYFPHQQSHFVKRLGDRLQLHDEMEWLVRKYGWEFQTPISIDDEQCFLAQQAVEVYDTLLEDSIDDIERAELEAEQLDYLLRLDHQRGYERFRELFDSRMEAFQFGLCTMLAAEIRPYITEYDVNIRFSIESRLAYLSFRLGNLEAAQAEWERLIGLDVNPQQQVEVFIGLHNSTWGRDIRKAESYLKQALRVCKEHNLPLEHLGRVQQLLGWTCSHAGRTEEAIQWYNECVNSAHQIGRKGARLYAEAQNSRGYCYALLGEFKKAEAQVWDALTLRQKRGWKADVGRSYSTRGEVARLQGDFRIANAFYNEAVRIFKEINDQEWLALVLHTRGQNARLLARKYFKHGEFERANEWLTLARQGLEESLAKYEYYNLTRQRSQMLRRLGRVLKDVGELERARKVTLDSLSIAQRNENILEQLKSAIALSEIAARMESDKEIESSLAQLEQVGKKLIGKKVFSGLAHLHWGVYYYQQRSWAEAFNEISAGLVDLGHAGGRGRLYFYSYHDELQIQLNGLPDIETKRDWCDRLIEIWKREKLDEEFPEIIHLCEGYRDSLKFL